MTFATLKASPSLAEMLLFIEKLVLTTQYLITCREVHITMHCHGSANHERGNKWDAPFKLCRL